MCMYVYHTYNNNMIGLFVCDVCTTGTIRVFGEPTNDVCTRKSMYTLCVHVSVVLSFTEQVSYSCANHCNI